MSGEQQVEDALARVRPAGPPADLRTRILSAAPERSAWPWLGAAAALLCLGVALHGATSRQAAAVVETTDGSTMEAHVARITTVLGPGGESRRLATFFAIAGEVAREASHIEERR